MTLPTSLRLRFCALIALLLLVGNAARGEERLSFNRDVRPILADACFHCHGPDPGSRKAGLRFDREEGFFGPKDGKGDGEPPVVRGKPEASPLYQRITSTDADTVMPPPDAHRQLKPAEKETLRRWIAEGAEWQTHWSYIRPERPELPAVKNDAWVRNPIDRFVLAKLEAMKLSPAPEAEATALCRRLYLDLTGLPPTPEEVAEFVAAKSPQAYEKLVDKLLASPRYGEHRARYWLDAARYADTHGLHFDNYREIWPYRDWVIRAFNDNQPFDRFTIEQIAGDLLPNPTDEQRIATGFHRCNITTNEGGTIADENLAGYARDRVETTAWVWLGVGANCCVCHDHKFDPFTMREFYSMSAYFRNTTQGSHDGNIKDTKPVLFIPQGDDGPRYKQLAVEIAAAKKRLDELRPAASKAAAEWLATVKADDVDLPAAGLVARLPLQEGAAKEKPAKKAKGAKEKAAKEEVAEPKAAKQSLALKLADGKSSTLEVGGLTWQPGGKFGPAPVIAAETTLDLPADLDAGNFDRDEPFSVALWVRTSEKSNDGPLLARVSADGKKETWKLYLFAGGKLALQLQGADGKKPVRITTRNTVVKPNLWTHVTAVYDGSGTDRGVQLFVNGNSQDLSPRGTPVESSMKMKGTVRVGGGAKKDERLKDGSLQDVRLYASKLSSPAAKTLASLADVTAAARIDAAKRNPQQKTKLTTFYLDTVDPQMVPVAERLVAAEEERKRIESRSVVTHVQEEKMNSQAMANLLIRGAYDKPGEELKPGVFAALHPLPKDAPPNRLGLAQWLVDKANPLTPRVVVNRYWQEIFGTGLVKTSEDFGIMGEQPSHPELLDWLAIEFRDGGWDTKRMIRLLVTSAAYRQSAAATPEKIAKDRENRLLSRGPRFRMDAEMIRDYALAASGTLSKTMGGPSVKPYQPEGLWDIVGLPGGNTRDYKPDAGDSLYRRSIYTFWKRMSPPPNMETFNAPSREFSCLRRERTNTPLQALITLNDPQFVEASRNAAQAVLKETKGDPTKTLDVAAKRILCRSLKPQEEKVVSAALAELLSYYHGHKSDAEALIAVGESKPDASLDPAQLAAWTNLCNSLLNLDEALNK